MKFKHLIQVLSIFLFPISFLHTYLTHCWFGSFVGMFFLSVPVDGILCFPLYFLAGGSRCRESPGSCTLLDAVAPKLLLGANSVLPVPSRQVRGGPVCCCGMPRCPVPVCARLGVHLGFPSRPSTSSKDCPPFGPALARSVWPGRCGHGPSTACSGQRPSAGAPKRRGGHTSPWPWNWLDRRPAVLRGVPGPRPRRHSPAVSWPAGETLLLSHSALSACGERSGLLRAALVGTARCARSARTPEALSVALCGQRVAVPPTDGASGSFGQPGGPSATPLRVLPPVLGRATSTGQGGAFDFFKEQRWGPLCPRGPPPPACRCPRCSHRQTGSQASLVA